LTDRASFDATAKYWAETFAGATSKKTSNQTSVSTTPKIGTYLFYGFLFMDVDIASMYGLSPETVDRYVSMGFDREVVIEKMRKLSIRSLTMDESEGEKGGRLLEELLSSTS